MLTNTNRPIEDVIRRSCAAADPAQPHARQLEQVAEVAIGLGLELAQRRPAADQATAGADIELAVESFAALPCQETLDLAAQHSGVPMLAILAGVVLKHCHGDLAPLDPAEVAWYAVQFALELARAQPALAEVYRRLRSP